MAKSVSLTAKSHSIVSEAVNEYASSGSVTNVIIKTSHAFVAEVSRYVAWELPALWNPRFLYITEAVESHAPRLVGVVEAAVLFG
ncbi:MAG: hypothetical protein KGZ81_07455 [Flavobacteriales bacterium]|nr:hypothetical protein [Flavobacteriales bacterium]